MHLEVQVAQDRAAIGEMVRDVAECNDGFGHRGVTVVCCQWSGNQRSDIVRFGWQTGDAQTGATLGADVEADQQRRDLLHDARVLQLATIERAYAWDFAGEAADALRGGFVVAAYDHVAIDLALVVQNIR